jgi:hypothetical protein
MDNFCCSIWMQSIPYDSSLLSIIPILIKRNRYSDWLRAGRPRGRNSCLCKVKNFYILSRPSLGPTQPTIKWLPSGDRSVKLTTHLYLQRVPRSRKRGPTHPLLTCLDGVVVNFLSAGTTLPVTLPILVMSFRTLTGGSSN